MNFGQLVVIAIVVEFSSQESVSTGHIVRETTATGHGEASDAFPGYGNFDICVESVDLFHQSGSTEEDLGQFGYVDFFVLFRLERVGHGFLGLFQYFFVPRWVRSCGQLETWCEH